MYGQSAGPAPSMGAQAMGTGAPPDYGIASAIRELEEEILRADQIASKMHGWLGISVPEQGAQNTPAASSLVGHIRSLIISLRSSNNRFEDSLRHIST